jgi:hypothetical protein
MLCAATGEVPETYSHKLGWDCGALGLEPCMPPEPSPAFVARLLTTPAKL